MQTYWLNGGRVSLTPRQELRLLLPSTSMNDAERMRRNANMSREAFQRFERLWAVSTATEHPYTRSWSLDRGRARRARACAAIKNLTEASSCD